MKVAVITLGCKVNECESRSLISELKGEGAEVTEEQEYADAYIVNTCSVTGEADRKSSKNLILGYALTEATAIYGFIIGIMIIFFLQ